MPTDQPLPDGCYRLASNRCTLGTPGSSTTTCTQTGGAIGANFSPALSLSLIGSGWASWSVPPDAEDPSPTGHLLVGYNGGGTTLLVTLTADASIAGLEIEQNIFDTPYVTTAVFKDASGATLATISRSMLGRAGARLFGVECTAMEVHSIMITSDPNALGFAIAQVRSDRFAAGAEEEITLDPGLVPDVPWDAAMNTD